LTVLAAGFADPVMVAQSTFRAVLAATARPGTVSPIAAELTPPEPFSRAAAAIALSLCDQDTPVWLDARLRATEAIPQWLRFHCGAKIVDEPSAAAFAFAGDGGALPDFACFNLGSVDYPDRSTTVVIQVESLQSGPPLVLAGPGIRSQQTLRATPLPPGIAARLTNNRALFPRGVDLLLASADAIAALPRSVRLVEHEERPCM
jgi:alpha-D-ribose 1-methylphosphonate 5-triphosphate synthase subunit PhnH